MRKASSGNAPGRPQVTSRGRLRDTLACSTAEAICASLIRQQAGSLSNPPRPRMTRDTLRVYRLGIVVFGEAGVQREELGDAELFGAERGFGERVDDGAVMRAKVVAQGFALVGKA